MEQEDIYCKEMGLSKLLRTPLYGRDPTFPLWDLQIYSNFDVPYHHRYTSFRLPEMTDNAIKLYDELSGGEPYVLLHRYSSHQPGGYYLNIEEFRAAYNLPDIKIIEVKEGITNNMMDYTKLIMEASEIHCVASSFFALVDSMVDKTRADLYLHDMRSTAQMRFNSDYNGHRWKIVQY